MLKLNRCGPIHAAGWTNVDASRRAWFASRLPSVDRWLVRCRVWPPTEFSAATHFADLLRPLPWPDGEATAIYLGEVLEHLTREDACDCCASASASFARAASCGCECRTTHASGAPI